jgi:macrolide phosphotransferase
VIRSDLALAALASAAVPGMKPVSVTGVRPVPDDPSPRHQVAFVEDATGRTWVVRVPLDPAAGAELERNDALVRMLGRHLPFKVPAASGYASVGTDGRAAVFPYVEGSALNLRNLPSGAGLAGAVGRAVAAVHNIPRGLFEEMAVPVFDAAGVRSRRLAVLDRAAETGHVPTGLLARWEQALEAVPLWHFATTPVHGSLDGDSFLVAFTEDDAATGRVVAMTGWEHAQIADPAEDLAALVDQAPPRAFDTVVDSYALARSQRPDPHIVQRARLAAEMRLLDGLAAAVAAGDDGFVRARADRLRRLDRLTSADDSLVPRTALVAMEPVPEPVPLADDTFPAGTAPADDADGTDLAAEPAAGERTSPSDEPAAPPSTPPAGEVEDRTEEIAPPSVGALDEPEDDTDDTAPDEPTADAVEDNDATERMSLGEPPASAHPEEAPEAPAPEVAADLEAEPVSGDEPESSPGSDQQDPATDATQQDPATDATQQDPATAPSTDAPEVEDAEETERLQTLYDMPADAPVSEGPAASTRQRD